MADKEENAYRIGVISDTHGQLRPEIFNHFAGVDLILHCGDVEGDHLIDELAAIAPIQAISGNVDWPRNPDLRPDERRIETAIGRIAMTHGHHTEAPSTDRAKMAAHFADFKPDVILYGHSHIPLHEQIDGVQVINPGAAGPARFGRPPSVAILSRPREALEIIQIELPG